MGGIQFRPVSRSGGLVLALAATGSADLAGQALRDVPVVWYADDMRDAAQPRRRDPNIVRSAVDATLFRPIGRFLHPGRLVRRIGAAFGGDELPPAANINALDEVINSSWFTNRIGLFAVDPSTAARGPIRGSGPDRSGQWTVVSAKTEGVTPGFNILDARGDVYVIKFDPSQFAGMASAAGVISGRIFHTAGYNVPEDQIVTFARSEVVVGPDVEITLEDGTARPMTDADLDELLASVVQWSPGVWRALASRYLPGTPIGPFDWKGRRQDDSNDRIDHQDRRELRGLRMFAAWLCHYDTKQGNTLDMYQTVGDRQVVRHYLIDFASTLGAGALGPFPAACYEHSLDAGATMARALSLGLERDPWRRLELPDGLSEVGYLESEVFDPMAFKPLEPNAAFANMTDRDGYWAAKIISAFRDEHLAAIVAEAQYRSPEAASYMIRTLAARRDRLATYWFARVPPLDFFALRGDTLHFHDLAVERGVFSAESSGYRFRVAATRPDRSRGPWSRWAVLARPAACLCETTGGEVIATHSVEGYPFLTFEVQVNREDRWSRPVTVYLSRESGRVVALER